MPSYSLIAALGSSFAAGAGVDPIVDAGAGRSGRNYPHQLAERLGAELVDLTVSGATTDTLLDTAQTSWLTGAVYPPQLRGVPIDADLLTITVGGNDLGFTGSMLYRALRNRQPGSAMAAETLQRLGGSVPRPTAAVIRETTARLVRVVGGARLAAPDARLVLVDYLTVLERVDSARPASPFTDADLSLLLPIQDAVAAVFAGAAAETEIDLVRASELGRGHAIGSTDPWLFPLDTSGDPGTASFHPTATGHAAVADALEALLSD